MKNNIDPLIQAAYAGGKVIQNYFGQSLYIEEKSHITDFRTKADIESEEAILDILTAAFPDYTVIAEESGLQDKSSPYSLVIDPLDGTNNFVLGIPNFSVSIGLFHDDEIIAGVIYIPILDLLFKAEKGKGAWCNDERLKVNAIKEITKATVSYTCGYLKSFQEELPILKRLRGKSIKRYITNWSPAYDYCLLASGKIEGIINNENDLYDYAAGKLIAREAGALITTFSGEKQNDKDTSIFLMTNGTEIHQEFLEIINAQGY